MIASLSLLAISLAAGVLLLWIFARTSDQAAIRITKKRLQARLLEMRLYADDPRVVLRAQRALLTENLRYFGLMVRPAAIATVPMLLVLILLDGFYGRRPLEPGRSTIVTVGLGAPLDPPPAALAASDGFRVETPPAHAVTEREISWRIRAERAARGELRFEVGGAKAVLAVRSGGGLPLLGGRRSRSLTSWLVVPWERRLESSLIERIEVEYPSREISYFGLETHWLVWFLVFSMGGAFLLKSRFGVTL